MAPKNKTKTLVSSSSSEEEEEYEKEPKTPIQTPNTNETSSDDTDSSDSDSKQPQNRKVASKQVSFQGIKVSKRAQSSKKADSKASGCKSAQEPKPGNNDNRIWSEEEEIKVLEWVLNCKTEGTPLSSDMDGFNSFIGKVYEKRQLSDKIYKLKKKFLKYVGSWEKVGSDNVYDDKFYGLGKEIWGSEMMSSDKKVKDLVSSRAKTGKRKVRDSVGKKIDSKRAKVEIDVDEFWSKYPRLKESIKIHNSGLFGKENMGLVFRNGSKLGDKWAEDMEAKWRLYAVKEEEVKLLEVEVLMEDIKKEMEIDIAETS